LERSTRSVGSDWHGASLERSELKQKKKRESNSMVKKTATFGGLLLVVAGLIGLVAPGLIGMHPSVTHNLVHLVSGGMALFFGLKL
jgi:hypothetical protein